MSANRTVLITGATGFIGREVVAALNDAGWNVIRCTRETGSSLLPEAVHLDLADPAAILELGKGPRCDAIVHLGARVGLSGETDSELFAQNVLATGCLAYLANLWNAHLIYASTAIVHGVKCESVRPETPVCTDTVYAKSKWLGEQLIEASNARHCILRIAGVFGHAGPAHLGLNRAIDGAIKSEPPVQVGSGSALRNYVYVKDVASAIIYALEEHLTGIHLLAGDEVISVGEMLQKVCDTFMPGMHPVIRDGGQALDQVTAPSASLPKTRSFHEALIDIQHGCHK